MLEFIEQNEIQIVFIICSLFGGMAHYLKKFLKKETDVQMGEWFGSKNLPSTIYTFIVFFFAIIGAIAADVVNDHTGFWAAMYSGFVTGFAIDSGFNSDRRPGEDLPVVKRELKELLNDSHKSK